MSETRKFNLHENCFIIPTLLIYPEKSARLKKKKRKKSVRPIIRYSEAVTLRRLTIETDYVRLNSLKEREGKE